MGTLSCQRCFATAEGNTQEEADELIDHALGMMIGRPCEGKASDLKWTDTSRINVSTPETPPKIETPKSSKKTQKTKKG